MVNAFPPLQPCRFLPHGSRVQQLSVHSMLPIMYYRPARPEPTPHLKAGRMLPTLSAPLPGRTWAGALAGTQVHLQPGANLKKASTAVRDVAKGKHPCPGWQWGDDTLHEHEARPRCALLHAGPGAVGTRALCASWGPRLTCLACAGRPAAPLHDGHLPVGR